MTDFLQTSWSYKEYWNTYPKTHNNQRLCARLKHSHFADAQKSYNMYGKKRQYAKYFMIV